MQTRSPGFVVALVVGCALAIAGLGFAPGACSSAHAAAAGRGQKLEPGKPFDATLELAKSSYAEFHVDVPADAVVVRWTLVARRVELDLRARRGASVDDDNDAQDFRMTSDGGRAQILYTRFTDPAVGKDRYYARVEWPYQGRPRTVAERIERIAFTIQADLVSTRIDGALEPSTPTHGRLDTKSGGFRTYTIDVPADTRALRFDIADATSDLDLFVRRGSPVLVIDESVRFAQHAFGRETLVVQNPDGSPIEAGRWCVDVVDTFPDDRAAEFTLYTRLDAAPPPELLGFPKFPPTIGPEPLGRALAAVVEITIDDSSGSGTLLTKDGWILTNAHVVLDVGGARAQEAVVALTLDPRNPAVELFRAEVREVDEERDMALMRITKGFFGQDLPADLELPCVELAASEPQQIGDTIYLVGYPATGGQGSRVTISATRGIVAGFDAADFGSLLKTDAEITSGNSGGAALDARGRLIGIPTSTVENGSGQIGYVHPLSALPAAWRELVFPSSKPK